MSWGKIGWFGHMEERQKGEGRTPGLTGPRVFFRASLSSLMLRFNPYLNAFYHDVDNVIFSVSIDKAPSSK